MSSRGRVEWSRLENAAKIFQPTSGLRDTKVFRFACELREPVDRELLQKGIQLEDEAAVRRAIEDYTS